MSKKSAIFVVPYFGQLPAMFPFWIQSCANNESFTWLIVTDCKINFKMPKNVIIKEMSFNQLQSKIKNLFGNDSRIDNPYKLCDYRPAYGIIFKEYIQGYDFFGWCDIDLIWGNMSRFISDNIFAHCDKILDLGHCTLIKNDDRMSSIFMEKVNGCLDWELVRKTKNNMTFDEDGDNVKHLGFRTICKKLRCIIYENRDIFADIIPGAFSLIKILSIFEKRYFSIFYYDNGTLWQYYSRRRLSKEICKEEQFYVHLQKRKLEICTDCYNKFLIIPPGKIIGYYDNWENDIDFLANESFKKFLFEFKNFVIRYPRRLRFRIVHLMKLFLQIFIKSLRDE